MEEAPRSPPSNGVTKQSPSPTGPPSNGVRKQPPSPTRDPGPELSKPSASPPPPLDQWWAEPSPPSPETGKPSWLILDRFVHRSRRRRGVVAGDATASEIARDCVGRPISASLRVADPPAVSRLYLHWSDWPDIDRCPEPTVIAAHRNSILFRLTVPFKDPIHWDKTVWFPKDYFVYSCSSPPSLTLLPPCFDGGHPDPKLDNLFQPYRRQQQRTMIDRQMGILCHGDKGEFTVADLEHHSKQEVQLCLLHRRPPTSHDSMEWSVKKLQIPSDMKIDPYTWRTDVVLPIGGRCLCWVDYYQGMLLVDVLTGNNSRLHYIALPSKALKSRRMYIDRGEPDPFRCLSVSDTGIIKLVCILRKEHPSPSYPFTIETWTLADIHHARWEKDGSLTMGASGFFDLYTAESCLPRVQPSFPVVSLVDPDIICFLLKDKGCNLFWMVQVNTRKKLLQSSALYINEEEEEGFPATSGLWKRFFGHYFISSKFSSYLSENAITSRKLSETMQKAKEGSVHKCELEARAEEYWTMTTF